MIYKNGHNIRKKDNNFHKSSAKRTFAIIIKQCVHCRINKKDDCVINKINKIINFD